MVETKADDSLLMRHLEEISRAAAKYLGVSDPLEAGRIKRDIYKAIRHPKEKRGQGPVVPRGSFNLQINED